MPVRLQLELPETAFSALRTSPDEFVVAMRLAAAVKWYEVGQLSQAKAAEIAGVSRAEFLAALSHFDVSPSGWEVLLDDRAARNAAKALGIACRGTLGILLLGKQSGSLVALRPVLNDLPSVGFRVSPTVTTTILKLAGEAD